MKDITIVMPFLNEGSEPINTIKSIYDTSDPRIFELIVIDDASSDEVLDFSVFKEVNYIKNPKRIGVDACRQIGVDAAKTPYVFIIDSHMRFSKNWLHSLLESISSDTNCIWCTTCMGLGYGNMNLSRSREYYKAANIVLENTQGEILEPKWRHNIDYNSNEVPCVLGANYGFSKSWFDHIHGLQGLKMWGSSEVFLSLKSWLAGGSCKINTGVKIGHKFRSNAPYSTEIWNLIYNKIFVCQTVLPLEMSRYLQNKFPKNINYKMAMDQVLLNRTFIENEKQYYQSIFNRDFYELCRYLKITLPSI